MKGKIVLYRDNVLGIVLDCKPGYHLRDSATGQTRFIADPLYRIYWLRKPHGETPLFCAPEEILYELEIPDKLSFGFGTCLQNVEFLEELDVALNYDEWYLAKHFIVYEEGDSST